MLAISPSLLPNPPPLGLSRVSFWTVPFLLFVLYSWLILAFLYAFATDEGQCPERVVFYIIFFTSVSSRVCVLLFLY